MTSFYVSTRYSRRLSFFKPRRLKFLGTHQDGGLHHNNPSKIARWEQKFIWPGKTQQPDFFLSVGTGTTVEDDSVQKQLATKGFIPRLVEAFNWNLDGEQAWKDFINDIPPEWRSRYHRLNLPLRTEEPLLDDVSTVEILKRRTDQEVPLYPEFVLLKDHFLSSSFYFELHDIYYRDGGLHCTGFIFCRLALDKAGRMALYQRMEQSSAYFLINGKPLPAIQSIPTALPPYKCRVVFGVTDLDAQVHITISGLTSRLCYLSGLPNSVRALTSAQGLSAAFGRADHGSRRPNRTTQKRSSILI